MRAMILAAAALAGVGMTLAAGRQAEAQDHYTRHYMPQCRGYEYGRPDLFYNFYTGPSCGGVGAQMYIAPVPVPPDVGHTYYTYQPLMSHEMLYRHKRSYHRYYNEGRGFTRTKVRWW